MATSKLRTTLENGLVKAVGAATRSRPEALRIYFDSLPLTAENVLRGYMLGYFPFTRPSGEMRWHAPKKRAVLLVDEFAIPKRFAQEAHNPNFKIRIDHDPMAVVEACAAPTRRRPKSWITPALVEVYRELIEMGMLHSVEAWQDDQLVGGEFGLAIGSYFSSESAFSRVRNASKVTFVYLHRALRDSGFELIDLQFISDYLREFGAREIPRHEYRQRQLMAMVKPQQFRHPEQMPGRSTVPPAEPNEE
ncbi:MAG: leucyl/phenylalanyl-tRNA--protein transferase [Polyangiales bacterium]